MRQQINLFQDGLIAKKAPLSVGSMLGILIGCALLLVVASVYLTWQQSLLKTELTKLIQKQVQVAANLQNIKTQNPPRQKDPLLAQTLKLKQEELAGRKPLLRYLETFKFEMATGFSPVIEGLAQYPLKGVWLTGIHLNNPEHKVLLAGSAIRSDLIPAYVKHLGDKKVLKDQNFASLKVMRLKEQSRQVDFRLESDFGVADE